MATLHDTDRQVRTDRRAPVHTANVAMDERQVTSYGDGANTALRAVGTIAGAVATVFGAVALIRLDWSNGLDSAPVEVGGLLFEPGIAIATLALGLIALAAGASRDRGAKLGVGILLGCLGLATLLAGTSRANWGLETGHGWLALVVGAVLAVTGLLMRRSWSTRHIVEREAYGR